MPRSFVELTAPSLPRSIVRFQRVMDRLVGRALTQDERQDLRLALEELLLNAVEWGNRNDARKRLRLAYRLSRDRIVVRIADEGAGFAPGKVPDPTLDPRAHVQARLAAGKRLGGWGLFLARKLADEVRFNQKGNVVFLTKYFRRKKVGAGGTHVRRDRG
jgi:anti-sigma regulatory factor (Ser/Thr protein kinase)